MMKFATAKEHRDYFRKHRHVEFEGLLTVQQCMEINLEIDAALAQRLGMRVSSLLAQSVDKLYTSGRDLCRASPKLKKISLHKGFAEAAADLLEHKPLRIGYDQLLPGSAKAASMYHVAGDHAYMHRSATLPEVSCIQGVVGGLILCIKASETSVSPLFPTQAGHGVFLAPDMVIDFNALEALTDARYLLITYAQYSSVYCHQEGDPQVNYFRSLGYNFGDRLSEKLHPQVYS